MRDPFQYVDASGDCWEWTGSINFAGYGLFWTGERHLMAHRAVWKLLVGPINETLDHLCRVRHCVNPDHLDPVPQSVNVLRGYGPTAENARKTHCKYGHPFDDENTYFEGTWRRCRACNRRRARRGMAKLRAAS